MNDFEATAAYLVPRDPVARKRKNEVKRPHAEVSVAEVTNSNNKPHLNSNKKPRIGVTGVELRYHKHSEYQQLTKLQRSELREWRNKNGKPSQKGSTSASAVVACKINNMVSAAVAKKFKKMETKILNIRLLSYL